MAQTEIKPPIDPRLVSEAGRIFPWDKHELRWFFYVWIFSVALVFVPLITYRRYTESTGYGDWPVIPCATGQVQFIARVPGQEGDSSQDWINGCTSSFVYYLSPVGPKGTPAP